MDWTGSLQFLIISYINAIYALPQLGDIKPGTDPLSKQKSYKVNNVVAAKILRDPSKGSKERKKCSLSFRLPSSLPPSLPRRTCAVSLASSRWQF